MLNVKWAQYANGGWPALNSVDLSNVTTEGVYVIWQAGQPGRVVRVGQGNIQDRLCCHRADDNVLAHANPGLLVTWAAVPVDYRDSVERFLAVHYTPLAGDRWPNVPPVAVNLPGAA
jgi:hypothetical protein